jgi:nucleotide-binding universal stress UspA family protein
MYEHILVPTDGSPCSDEAIVHAVAIAHAMGSTIAFLFVMDTLSARRDGVVNIAEAQAALTTQGRAILERAERMASDAAVRATVELVEGDPADVIARRSAGFDLVVMGSHGKGILKRLAVGSVTHAIQHRIQRPLLLVRCVEEPD